MAMKVYDVDQLGHKKVYVDMSKVLGKGAYGSVVEAKLDQLPCAAKIQHTNVCFPSDADDRFDQECRILRDLKHPCIVQFLCVVQDPGNRRPILLMELMVESLTGFLKRSQNPLPYHVQVSITHDIALALAYLHAIKIIHRDLSSNNILLNAGIQAKVTDFGMSKIVREDMNQNKLTQCPGTRVFMPPEALRDKPRYSYKLDTFSVGVLIIQIITRTFPAPTVSKIVINDRWTGKKIVRISEQQRRKKDIDNVPSDHSLLPIARHCLKDREQERPTATQLCQSLEQLKAARAYERSKAAENQPSRASLLQQLRLKENENAQLQEQLRKERESKGKENAKLKRQLQSVKMSAPAQPQRSTAAVRRVSKPEDEKALYEAAKSGDVSAVRRLVSANVNVDCTPFGNGWTPLHIAAKEGKVDVVKLLRKARAQLDIQAKNGVTALNYASIKGHTDVVDYLIRAGASINLATRTGATSVHAASQEGHTVVVDHLIRAGASINLADTNGMTALHYASFNGHTDVVDYLIRAGASINLATTDGMRPIDVARAKKHTDIVRLLKRGNK